MDVLPNKNTTQYSRTSDSLYRPRAAHFNTRCLRPFNHSLSGTSNLVGAMNTVSVSDSASRTDTVSFGDNPSAANTSSTSANLTNTVNVSATTGFDHFTRLPKELRDRIYAIAFNDQTAFILAVDDVDLQNSYCLTRNFPIALRATCQLMHDEVENYLTTRWDIILAINTIEIEFQLQDFIPVRYLGRVRTIASRYKLVLQHNVDLYLLPELARIVLRLPIWFKPCRKEYTDFIVQGRPSADKVNEVVRELVGEAFGTLDEHDDFLAAVHQLCVQGTVEVQFHLRICLGEEEVADVVFDIEILYNSRVGVKATARPRLLEKPTRFDDMPLYMPASSRYQ